MRDDGKVMHMGETVCRKAGAQASSCHLFGAMLLAALMAGCSSTPQRAPVEERPQAQGGRQEVPVIGSGSTAAGRTAPRPPPPGAENAGKPGFYTVRPGDTLIRIGLDHGQNWRDIVRWSMITNPNQIEVGQVLRVSPPPSETLTPSRPVTAASVPAAPATAAGVSPVAVAQPVLDPGARPPAAAPVAPAPVPVPVAVAAAPAVASASPAVDPAPGQPAAAGGIVWAWPSSGPVVGAFDETNGMKGLSIGGNVGDPVLAAADGRVVYAGSGLRGYGNLVIVKHDATFLTAYAHNQALLVKEDQAVRRGQKIAEMGSSDADRVKLHFEVRRLGKPVDPATVLPAR